MVLTGGVRVIDKTACGAELTDIGILSDSFEATPDGIKSRMNEVQSVLRNNRIISEENRQKLIGTIGELKTLEALLNLDKRHIIINDVQLLFDPPLKLRYKSWGSKFVHSAKIDHVVVGPIGAVAIESKYWSAETLDAVLRKGDFDPYSQAMRMRRALKHFLRERMDPTPWVYALVSMSGAGSYRPYRTCKKVVAPQGLCKRIMRGSRTTDEQIEEVVYWLSGTRI